jgi:hypothetical protein
MQKRLATASVFTVLAGLIVAAAGPAQEEAEFGVRPTWEMISAETAGAQLQVYLQSPKLSGDQRSAAREAWNNEAAEAVHGDLLDRLAAALAKADERVAELVEHCAKPREPGPLSEFAWLADSETPALVRHNMRLYFARWLVQQGYYDEAISWTDGLTTSDVVAPEALLFYRAVAHQRLVEPDKALVELSQLVTRRDELPVRYQKLADLMQKDLAALEDESLDHIARRMEDVRRRLAQGRSGERVQKIEQGVVDSLDKLIKELEEQMQQQQSSGAGQAGGSPSQAPMQDSQIAELKGPGSVERRDVGDGAGWGNLPEKDRERALQEIGREFPSHYREVIEEYFRRLAAEGSAGDQ